jgi:hypothetical protein
MLGLPTPLPKELVSFEEKKEKNIPQFLHREICIFI